MQQVITALELDREILSIYTLKISGVFKSMVFETTLEGWQHLCIKTL